MAPAHPTAKSIQWKRLRALGWWHFVLLHGVVKMGGLMLLVLTLLPFAMGKSLTLDPRTQLVQIAIYAAVGFAYGAIIWHLRERIHSSTCPTDQANHP